MTELSDLPLREELRGMEPYGAPQPDVPVRLNVNENTHAIPESVATEVVTAVARAVLELNRYPDREFTALRESLAGYLGHGLTAAQLWAANGSNEVLQHVLQAFGGPGRSVLGFPPTYSMYPLLAAGTHTRWVTAQRDAGYAISPQTAVTAIERERPDVVFFCTPNNPTGTPVPLETIEAAYQATDGIVLVDEAYAEFSDAPSGLTLLPGRPRLLVSRTMSKAFAFAGARLGYLAADAAVADALRLVRLPYHLSALTPAAAIAALGQAQIMLATVADIVAQRNRISAALPELGYEPVPTASNFVLFGGMAEPRRVFEALLADGVIVRETGIPGHLRVTAGTEAETTMFLDCLAKIEQ